MIHLINNPTPLLPWRINNREDAARYREDITTFFALPDVNPIHNIKVTFNDFKVKSARLPLQDSSLEVTGTPSTVVVPEVELHEVLMVDLED